MLQRSPKHYQTNKTSDQHDGAEREQDRTGKSRKNKRSIDKWQIFAEYHDAK